MQEDDEFVVQLLYLFLQLLRHKELSDRLMGPHSALGAYVIDLMHDKNPSIRAMCENALIIIGVYELYIILYNFVNYVIGSSLRSIIMKMWEEEQEHLDIMERLAAKHDVQHTIFLPLFSAAAYALGIGTALIGKEGAMACTVAVEELIGQHYNNQIKELLADDPNAHEELLKILTKLRDEELHHHDTGVTHDGLKTGCKGAIFVMLVDDGLVECEKIGTFRKHKLNDIEMKIRDLEEKIALDEVKLEKLKQGKEVDRICCHAMSESDVLDYFDSRHITLKKEWMQSAIGFIKYQEKGRKVFELCEAVMEQLIYSDLRDSYLPSMKIPTAAIKAVIVKRMLFQIMKYLYYILLVQVVSVINIARSTYELYQEKTNVKDDLTWFNGDSEDEFINSGGVNSRRMLKVRLTDGSNTLDATEYGGMIPLTEDTLPGTKVLLTSRVICRRGIMLLNESNCQNIKEVDYSVNSMCSTSVSSVKIIDVENTIAYSSKALNDGSPLFKELDKDVVTVLPKSPIATTSKDSKPDITSAQELEIVGVTRENERPPVTGKGTRSKKQDKEFSKPSHRSITEYFTQMFRPTSIVCEDDQDKIEDSDISAVSIHPIPVVPLEKQQLKVHISEHICGFSSPKRSCSPIELITAIVPFKKAKSGINIDCVKSPPTTKQPSMDQASVDLEFPSFTTQLSTEMDREHIMSVTDPMLISAHSNDASIVERFLRLNTMRLADVISQKKFWMLPKVVNITGICRVSIDLRAENNQWLLFVFVSDESCDQLKCQVASVLLDKLLGFSVKYCQNLSAAKEKAELMKCKERAIEVMRSLQRLDLIFSIEMPTQREKIPIVINVKTLPEALQLC
uniref:RecQ-mediated genome instability protein 1 n=1 Tax=Heterorhabditis bacteriophora TaxID=37862 RepID=A0A1I7XN55_HETBA